jgi:hypothetical protein
MLTTPQALTLLGGPSYHFGDICWIYRDFETAVSEPLATPCAALRIVKRMCAAHARLKESIRRVRMHADLCPYASSDEVRKWMEAADYKLLHCLEFARGGACERFSFEIQLQPVVQEETFPDTYHSPYDM